MCVHVGDCIYRMCLWEKEFNLNCHSSGAILFSKTQSHWDLGLMDSSRQVSQWAPGTCSPPPLHYWNYKPKTPHEAFWCMLWGLTHQLTNWTTPQSSTPLSYALEQSLRALNFVFKSLNSQGLLQTLRTIYNYTTAGDLKVKAKTTLQKQTGSKLLLYRNILQAKLPPSSVQLGLLARDHHRWACWLLAFPLEGRRWGGP